MDDAEWDGLFLFDRRVLKTVGLKLPGKPSVQSSVGVRRLSWVREAIQEVVCRNFPPCLRNQLFPKLVHSAIGLLGMSDPVSLYLQDFNLRKG